MATVLMKMVAPLHVCLSLTGSVKDFLQYVAKYVETLLLSKVTLIVKMTTLETMMDAQCTVRLSRDGLAILMSFHPLVNQYVVMASCLVMRSVISLMLMKKMVALTLVKLNLAMSVMLMVLRRLAMRSVVTESSLKMRYVTQSNKNLQPALSA